MVKLHHVSIPYEPDQLDAGRTFYDDLLGLKEIPLPTSFTTGWYVWFALGDRELHLFKEEQSNSTPAAGTSPSRLTISRWPA